MPAYRYTAYDGQGALSTGSVDAASEQAALRELSAKGLVVVDLAAFEKVRKVALRPLSLETHFLFCKSLAGYLKSGLPITDALRLLAKQAPDKRLGIVYEKLLEEVEGGRQLAAAMETLGVFRDGLVGMVSSGEQSGSLPLILKRGAELYRQEASLRRQVRSALTYPIVMVCVGTGVVTFLLTYVVPKLAGLFSDLGQALPLPTRILLASADIVRASAIPVLVLGFVLFLFLRRRKKPINLPGTRRLRERVALSLVLSHLATLIEAGIPLVTALDMVAPMDPRGERWKAVADLVRKGHRFAAALEKEGHVAEDVVYVVRVGEMGNELPESLRQAGENAWEVAQATMERMASLVQPLLILVLAGVVGFVVVAVLLPVFEISSFVK